MSGKEEMYTCWWTEVRRDTEEGVLDIPFISLPEVITSGRALC